MGWEIRLTDLERGGQTARSFAHGTVRIGRHTDNELVLKHNQVSRLHLTLSKEGDRYFAEDSSRNGSFLKQGEQWTRLAGKTELKLPAVIRLADWSARIEYQVDEEWDKSVIIPAGHLVKRTEAILVFDLCESSRIANQNDHMAFHLKQRLMQICDPVLAEHSMRFLKGTGDGFLATFPSGAKALGAALEIEKRLTLRNARTANEPIHYRIALHCGETWGISTGGQDIHGNDVNITFRIEGVQREAFPDDVVAFPRMDRLMCSQAALAEIGAQGALPDGVAPIELGSATLKGIQDPVTLYWLKTG
ncbi:MAG: FHA domain-containing protein [Gammaproteobacteria bacterium]|nr:FHA domain-containing protein [Gammaproteobacteria bacterium]